MENSTEFYKRCVKQLLTGYESLTTGDSRIELIFDDERMRYMAVWVGWQKYRRIHQCAVHIDICNGQILIQWNDTEDLIDEMLTDMGIPKTAICLAMIPPNIRAYTDEYPNYRELFPEKKAA